jgi:hypothetical protein
VIPCIFIYSLTSDSTFILVEKRLNPFETTMKHLKTLDVYTVINDCEILVIAAPIGKKGIERLQEKRIKLFFRKGDIAIALNSVL